MRSLLPDLTPIPPLVIKIRSDRRAGPSTESGPPRAPGHTGIPKGPTGPPVTSTARRVSCDGCLNECSGGLGRAVGPRVRRRCDTPRVLPGATGRLFRHSYVAKAGHGSGLPWLIGGD
jgi:hypothetical protein